MTGEGAPSEVAVAPDGDVTSDSAAASVNPLPSIDAPSSRALVSPNAAGAEPVFREPWEAQAFAMTVLLHERGLFTWGEWAQALGAQIARATLSAADEPARSRAAADGAVASTSASDPASPSGAAAHSALAPAADGAALSTRDPASLTSAAAVGASAPAADGGALNARDPVAERSYYQHWLAALESLVAAKGASSADELTRYQRAWEHAAHRTPHGQSIDLQSQDLGG